VAFRTALYHVPCQLVFNGHYHTFLKERKSLKPSQLTTYDRAIRLTVR
jgi:hypothetical protein